MILSQCYNKSSNLFIYIFHISGLGCVVTTINPAYTAMEVCRQLIISKTKMILTLPKLVPLAQDAIIRSNSEFKTSQSKSGDWESMFFDNLEPEFIAKILGKSFPQLQMLVPLWGKEGGRVVWESRYQDA